MAIKKVRREITERLVTLLTAAFGLVAALAWNEAVKALFKGPCNLEGAGKLCNLSIYGPWVYAILVTIFVVIITIIISKFHAESE